MTLEFYKTRGKFNWRQIAKNGDITAGHNQGYSRKIDMLRTLKRSVFCGWDFSVRWEATLTTAAGKFFEMRIVDLTLTKKTK